MKRIPKMISTKDMMYISDMFNWHLVAAKKLELYITEVECEDCLDKINSLCKMHYEICNTLLKHLESENS